MSAAGVGWGPWAAVVGAESLGVSDVSSSMHASVAPILPIPPMPSDDALGPLLHTLADALRARAQGEFARTSYFRYALFQYSARRDEPAPTIRFDGFVRDARGVVEVYHVTPPPLDRATKPAWTAALKRWSKDADGNVTPQEGGAVVVTRRLTRKALADLVQGVLGEDRVAEVPLTLALATAPVAPLTDAAVRLLQQKLVKRAKGTFPVAALRDVIRALPGWHWTDPVPCARPYAPAWGERTLDRLLATLRPGVSYQARGAKPVEIHARVIGPLVVGGGGINPASVPGSDDLERLATVLHPVSTPLVDHAPVELPVGTWVAYGAGLDTNRYQDRVIRVPRLWQSLTAARVTAPSGASWPLYDADRDRRRPELLDDKAFLAWAYAQGLATDGEAALATVSERVRAHALRPVRAETYNLGECQLCGNMQKLRPAKRGSAVRLLVDHGYHYPDAEGWRGGYLGQRADRCEGTGWRPYEKARDCLEWMAPRVEHALGQARAALETLPMLDVAGCRVVDVTQTERGTLEELPVAASLEGVAYLAVAPGRPGEPPKVGLGGATTPAACQRFLDVARSLVAAAGDAPWAAVARQSTVDGSGVYGVPARGIVGTYLPQASWAALKRGLDLTVAEQVGRVACQGDVDCGIQGSPDPAALRVMFRENLAGESDAVIEAATAGYLTAWSETTTATPAVAPTRCATCGDTGIVYTDDPMDAGNRHDCPDCPRGRAPRVAAEYIPCPWGEYCPVSCRTCRGTGRVIEGA